jgi:hypothetical protein
MFDRHPHDWVVYKMWASGEGAAGLKAKYEVVCTRCDAHRIGFADEIPTARFKPASRTEKDP